MRLKGDNRVKHVMDSRLERENKLKTNFSSIKLADKIFTENKTKREFKTKGEEINNSEK